MNKKYQIIYADPPWVYQDKSKSHGGGAESHYECTPTQELAKIENEDRNEISRILPLAFLAPNIVESILSGTQPVDLTALHLKRLSNLPSNWSQQRQELGFDQLS